MGKNPSKLLKFWLELKRRKVVKVMVLYGTTAFILLEAVSIVIDPLNLPEWILTLAIVLLVIGFPIALIFSWIFDITPEGIEVTVGQHENENKEKKETPQSKSSAVTNIIIAGLLLAVIILAFPRIFGKNKKHQTNPGLEKSIAVLPFSNDSNDSSNVYIINGLMESILNNLAKIEDLKVISRTSVERFRNNSKSEEAKLMPEIAADLNVNYIVEGSGQKYGDEIFLTVQLLEASTDKHLWSDQYKRKADDIIDLQIEIAKTIAEQIEVYITPEEDRRIKKAPTENPEAYDLYLKGIELYHAHFQDDASRKKQLEEAKSYFEGAVELDQNFALAYAYLSFIYVGLNKWNDNSNNLELINYYAEKALLADPLLAESYIAKAYYYTIDVDHDLAISYFEKALAYNPNSAESLRELTELYFIWRTNTEKHLEYALKLVRLDISTKDSTEIGRDFIRLSTALRLSGFFKEADNYINKAQDYGSGVAISRAELLSDVDGDFEGAKKLLLEGFDFDSLNTMQYRFIAQTYFFLKDFPKAYNYYRVVLDRTVAMGSFYERDFSRMGLASIKTGRQQEAEEYLRRFERIAENDESILKYFLLAELNATRGNVDGVLSNMRIYSSAENFPYWTIRFFKYLPAYDNVRHMPEFQKILETIESKFWSNHNRIRKSLERDGFI